MLTRGCRALARGQVVVTDSFGRPWRNGIVDVAIGVSGLAPLIDYRGDTDRVGYEHLGVTPDWRTLGEYFARGEAEDPQEVIRAHPDLAEPLREGFAAREILGRPHPLLVSHAARRQGWP